MAASAASIEHPELRPVAARRAAPGVRAAMACGAARSQAAGAGECAAARGRRARSARPDFRQALHRRVPAAAPSRMVAGRAIGRWHRDQRLHGERAALLSAGSIGGRGDALGTSPARERLQPRAAPADGVFRQGDHRPAGQPHHQRHRADPAAVCAGAVRDAAGCDGADRRRRCDGVARLASDADRADADSGDRADRARLSAAVGACGHALARIAQRHQRADGREHRRHERAAGDRRRTALRHAVCEYQSRALQGKAR